jgi:hypothetical protein
MGPISCSPSGGRTSGGCLATVEGERELETPSHQPPKAGNLLFRHGEKEVKNSYRASQRATKAAKHVIYESATPDGARIVNENNLLP